MGECQRICMQPSCTCHGHLVTQPFLRWKTWGLRGAAISPISLSPLFRNQIKNSNQDRSLCPLTSQSTCTDHFLLPSPFALCHWAMEVHSEVTDRVYCFFFANKMLTKCCLSVLRELLCISLRLLGSAGTPFSARERERASPFWLCCSGHLCLLH